MQLAAALPARLRRWGRAVVDGVLPPCCLNCGTTVDEIDALCGRCWASMTFFAPPWCALCGLPFPHPMGEGAICGACASRPASWDRARAVFRYDRHSRRLVLMLKHGDQTHLAGAFGRWMHRAGNEVLAERRPLGTGAAALDAALWPPLQPGGNAWRRRSGRQADRPSAPIGWCVDDARHRKG